VDGESKDFPPYPENYLSPGARAVLDAHRSALLLALDVGNPTPPLPENEVRPLLDNTWTDTGKAIFNNWLGLVYQLTDADRRRPFMPGIDPDRLRF
jgi:homoserine O-succinyltransferase